MPSSTNSGANGRFYPFHPDHNSFALDQVWWEIERPIDELPGLARQHSVVLTPHLTEPMPRDGKHPSEQVILQSGSYNLGFISVLTHDLVRLAILSSFYALTLVVLFLIFQAPDVALSELVVGAVAFPLVIVVAIVLQRGG